jgi:hypothetical protein
MTNPTFKVATNLLPLEGPKAVPAIYDLQANVSADVDLYQEMNTGDFEFCQSLYIDNRGAGDLEITVAGTDQRLFILANSQGYFPVLASASGTANFRFTASAAKTVRVHYINCPVAPVVWRTV